MIFLCPFLHCKALRTAMYKRYINSIIIIIIIIIIIMIIIIIIIIIINIIIIIIITLNDCDKTMFFSWKGYLSVGC